MLIDTHELTRDEELALASELSDSLEGKAVALTKDRTIVLDYLSDLRPSTEQVEQLVRHFVSRRQDAAHYSVERNGDVIVVRSPDPIAAAHRKNRSPLPDNLKQCPFCPFVTPYDELYIVHVRSHGFT